jgi:SAM-dependent methyltransferase/chromosome segregation ATPase
MIETKIPEINVSDLMDQVRAKAQEIRRVQARPKLPTLGSVPELPTAILPQPVVPKTGAITQAIHAARAATTVGRWIPKPLRGLFRRQNRFNNEILRTIEALTQTNAQLADRFRHLSACVEVQDQAIQQLAHLRRSDGDWLQDLAATMVRTTDKFVDTRSEIQGEIDFRIQQQNNALATALRRLSGIEAELRDNGTGRLVERFQVLEEQTAEIGASGTALRADLKHAEDHISHTHRELSTIRELSASQHTDLGRIGEHVRNLQAQADATAAVTEAYRRDLQRAGEHLRNLQSEGNALRETCAVTRVQLDGALADARELRTTFDRVGEHLRNLQSQVDRLADENVPLQVQHGVFADEVRVLREAFDRMGEHLRNLQNQFDREVITCAPPAALREAVARLEQRLTDDGTYLKGELSHHRLLLTQFMSSGAIKSARPRAKQQQVTDGNFDSFYVSFEDRFRGSRTEIKRRLEVYLPLIKASRAGSIRRPVLDVGCGRGEWLELLKEHKLVCRGVDANSAMHAQCVERGVDVVQADVLDFLRDVPDATLGAVTGFHIIEHLPLNSLLELISQTRRVLTPGGIAIFESPNCKNLIVGASNFHIDPTHRNPIFPETAELMLSLEGFEKIRIEYLSPMANAFDASTPELAAIRDLLYGPQDFGIIAYKPKMK